MKDVKNSRTQDLREQRAEHEGNLDLMQTHVRCTFAFVRNFVHFLAPLAEVVRFLDPCVGYAVGGFSNSGRNRQNSDQPGLVRLSG